MAQRLFSSQIKSPWADEFRPTSLDEIVGQRHLVGKDGALRAAPIHSLLLWGPPGCGKTTLARVLAERAKAQWEAISPVSAGVKDLRECVRRARERLEDQGTATVVFVDEAHRFNKSQQDYFLPHVEGGLLTFIGATTENPSFEINSALLSRVTVYRLDPLSEEDIKELLDRVCDKKGLEVSAAAKKMIAKEADGDARRLINTLEQLAAASTKIGERDIKGLSLARLRRFDKRGDDFYDQISAMIKSMRGSDPDAALYWLCRMLDGGADPLYLSRRVIRLATEDIGLADPNALSVAVNADTQFRILGSPEGELGIAMAVIYMACAPKSNAAYKAFDRMMSVVQDKGSEPVPNHLRNAPTKLMAEQGHGKDYRYAHDEPHGYAAGERYLPEGMGPMDAYEPTGRGFEKEILHRMNALRKLDGKAAAKGRKTGAKKEKGG